MSRTKPWVHVAGKVGNGGVSDSSFLSTVGRGLHALPVFPHSQLVFLNVLSGREALLKADVVGGSCTVTARAGFGAQTPDLTVP